MTPSPRAIFLMTARVPIGKQIVESGLLVAGVALSDDDERLLLGGQHGLDGGQRVGPAHRQRHEQMREQNGILQWQNGQNHHVIVWRHEAPPSGMRTSNMPSRYSRGDVGPFQVAGQRQAALEMTVSNLHLVITATFQGGAVAADAAQRQSVAEHDQFQVFGRERRPTRT